MTDTEISLQWTGNDGINFDLGTSRLHYSQARHYLRRIGGLFLVPWNFQYYSLQDDEYLEACFVNVCWENERMSEEERKSRYIHKSHNVSVPLSHLVSFCTVAHKKRRHVILNQFEMMYQESNYFREENQRTTPSQVRQFKICSFSNQPLRAMFNPAR